MTILYPRTFRTRITPAGDDELRLRRTVLINAASGKPAAEAAKSLSMGEERTA